MSDIPNISIGSITGGQNNIGKTEIAGDQVQHNHYGQPVPTFDVVLSTVAKAIPVEHRSELVATCIDPIKDEVDTATTMLADITEAAEAGNPGDADGVKQEIQEVVKTTLVDRVTKLAAGLQPYAPSICKALVAFGETALVGIGPPAGWAAGALLAAVKSMSAGGESDASGESDSKKQDESVG